MPKILQYPDKKLQMKSAFLKNNKTNNEMIMNIVEEMEELFKINNSLLGLSAIQLGCPVRLIAVKWGEVDIKYLVNPVIIKVSSQKYTSREGCASINYGDMSYKVERFKRVKVTAMSTDWKPISLKGVGIYSAMLQHEIDHLDGILISDKGRK